MNRLCDYGCGKEAKYSFKNGKWCCEKSHNKCPVNREKNLESLNQPEVKKKHKKAVKEAINKPEVKTKHIKSIKEAMNRPEVKEKRVKSNTFTIEQIQNKYPIFAKEEKMRYGPNGDIQFHCKYNECKNSEENGGWFTPTKSQFSRRKDALEKEDGNDGGYLYCSKECKHECCLYYFKSDPFLLKEYQRYLDQVQKRTYRTRKKYFDTIENIELQGKEHGYALDHKYSIYDGFTNNVDPKIIAHYKNLECIPELENSKKNKNSSITLEELLIQIEMESK